jgi:hypothetical protein
MNDDLDVHVYDYRTNDLSGGNVLCFCLSEVSLQIGFRFFDDANANAIIWSIAHWSHLSGIMKFLSSISWPPTVAPNPQVFAEGVRKSAGQWSLKLRDATPGIT